MPDALPPIAQFGPNVGAVHAPLLTDLSGVAALVQQSHDMVLADLQQQLGIAAKCTANCQTAITAWLSAEIAKIQTLYAGCSGCVQDWLANEADYARQLTAAVGVNVPTQLPTGISILPGAGGSSPPLSCLPPLGFVWYGPDDGPGLVGIWKGINIYGAFFQYTGPSVPCMQAVWPNKQPGPPPQNSVWQSFCNGTTWGLYPCSNPPPPPPPPPPPCSPLYPCPPNTHWDSVKCICVPDVPPPPPPPPPPFGGGTGGPGPPATSCCLTKADLEDLIDRVIKGITACFCPDAAGKGEIELITPDNTDITYLVPP